MTFLTNGGASGIVLNVKSFGATGDGATDDSAAIQAAVTALPEVGGTIYFPAAIYKCNTGIEVAKAGVRFYGDGWDQTTVTNGSIVKAGAAMAALIKTTSAAASFHLDTMALNGGGNAESVLKMEGLNCQVDNAFVRQPKTAGVAVDAAGESVWLTNLRVNNANQAETTGIKLSSTDGIVTGCKPVNCRYGFELTAGASGTQINGGHATPGVTIGKNAVFINGNASRVTISGLRIDNHLAGAGIQISPTSNVATYSITGVTAFQNGIENEAWPVIGVDTTNAIVKGLSITGCAIESAAAHLYSAFLAAVKSTGEAATNKTRIKSGGTTCAGNTVYAKVMYAAESEPLNTAGQNTFSADATTWEAK